jgi:acetyltransferase
MKELESIFFPKSIAVVGVPRGMKEGRILFQALIDAGFKGPLYPVNPNAREIDGFRTYPDLISIEGPVDLVIILVSTQNVESVLHQCVMKGAKAAIIYTAGYSELGTDEGRMMEERLLAIARQGGIRIIGPNCMGIYNPSHGISFFPALSTISGGLGFISQSGSLANMICRVAPQRSIYFSKAISIGNECDLKSSDFIEYLGKDEETRCIGLYLEGIKEGNRFLSILRDVCRRKPVVIWKAGISEEGRKAAISHTGSLTGKKEIWNAAFRQAGAVTVTGFEDLLDTLFAFYFLPEEMGKRIAIISGPGGLAVGAADACGQYGLELAQLLPETQKGLATVIPWPGTSTKNPIDIGLSGAIEVDLYRKAIEFVLADPSVDAVFVIGLGLTPELNERYTSSLIKARESSTKPIVQIAIPGFHVESYRDLFRAGIPVFSSPERAMKAYSNVWQYREFKKSISHG